MAHLEEEDDEPEDIHSVVDRIIRILKADCVEKLKDILRNLDKGMYDVLYNSPEFADIFDDTTDTIIERRDNVEAFNRLLDIELPKNLFVSQYKDVFRHRGTFR
jgi:hypothetical protein